MFYLCALTLFAVRVFCLTPSPDKCQARPPITANFFMAVHYQLYERDVMTKMIFERNVSQKVYSLRLNGEKRPIHVMDKADETDHGIKIFQIFGTAISLFMLLFS